MSNCDVCCEKYNKLNHKKVECSFCDLKCCRSCCQRYLLSNINDPHCMNCNNMWNREFIDMFCSKYFRNTDLKKHRENVLFEREKMLMPGTQPEVERIMAMRKLESTIQKQREELIFLYNKYNIKIIPNSFILPLEISKLTKEMHQSYKKLQELRNKGTVLMSESGKKFIRKCPTIDCKGFMNEDWFCGLCEHTFCMKCNEKIHNNHVCDPDSVKSMELINKDTKPCPKCGTMIHKLSGCSQMWCPDCHTAFDWKTGNIEKGRIHNPHYIEFKRSRISSREHGDIPCGGMPSFRELRENRSSNIIINFGLTLWTLDRDLMYRYAPEYDEDNRFLRISYMLNEIDEKSFKRELQRRDKRKEKNRDVTNIFRMVLDTGGDLLRQYLIDKSRENELVNIINELVVYTNGVLKTIRTRYNCVIPRDIYVIQ